MTLRPLHLGRLRPAPLLTLALLAIHDVPAGAETVQHTFAGTVVQVTDGTGGSLDMTPHFQVGRSARSSWSSSALRPGLR
jgi:hypothetical protein